MLCSNFPPSVHPSHRKFYSGADLDKELPGEIGRNRALTSDPLKHCNEYSHGRLHNCDMVRAWLYTCSYIDSHATHSGGGIGGLTLAVVLKKYFGSSKLKVELYEAGPKFTEIGAGITAWERTRDIFRTLDMWEKLDNKAVGQGVELRKSDTKPPFVFHKLHVPRKLPYQCCAQKCAQIYCIFKHIPDGQTGLTRVSLLNLLVEYLTPESTPFLNTHFLKRLSTYEQDADGVTLQFTDGSAARADILIGAEGLASPSRKKMYADLAERVRDMDPIKAESLVNVSQISWTGTHAYRTLLDREKLRALAPDNLMVDGTFLVSAHLM